MKATDSVITSRAARPKGRAGPRAYKTYSERWPVLAICFTGALALLWGLGKTSLHDWDEAIYAQISKEIVAGGDWWTLHWGYRPYLRKPPVFMWTTAVFYHLFGVSEFWARAASAFSGIGLLVVTYLTAKLIYDRWVGLLAVAILLTSYQFIASSRFGTTDIMLTLFTYLALYAYTRHKEGDGRWWYAVWVSCALALMTKSAAGVIAPATVILALFLDRRFKQAIRSRQFQIGLAAAFVMVVPWHISMFALHGQAFVDQYIGHSIVERTRSVLDNHTGDRYYYIDRLQKYFFPWVYAAPFALALSLREIVQGRSKARILWLLLVLVFGICLAVQTKLRWYIVPLYPALAILIASMIREALRDRESLAFSCLIVAAFIVSLLAPLKIVLVFGCAGLAVIALSLARRSIYYRYAALVMFAFLMAAGANTLRPLYEAGETPIAKLARIAARAGDESGGDNSRTPLILSSGLSEPAPLFYSDRPIRSAYTADELASFTGEQRLTEIILSREDVEPLSAAYDIQILEEAGPLVYATIRPVGDR